MKRLITERDVINAWKKRQSLITIPPHTVITPAASDAAKVKGIHFIRTQETPPGQALVDANSLASEIIIGCDHGGFELKQEIIEFLHGLGYQTEDVGTFSKDAVDYPDFALAVAQKVSESMNRLGIVIDGAGVGSAMAANKVISIRAAACYDVYTAKNSREHNFANVLSLGSRNTGIDVAKEIVRVWLSTPYGAERHRRRVEKIMRIEQTHRS